MVFLKTSLECIVQPDNSKTLGPVNTKRQRLHYDDSRNAALFETNELFQNGLQPYSSIIAELSQHSC